MEKRERETIMIVIITNIVVTKKEIKITVVLIILIIIIEVQKQPKYDPNSETKLESLFSLSINIFISKQVRLGERDHLLNIRANHVLNLCHNAVRLTL